VQSYKIRNGTFVLCTPKEAAERERRKAALAETARAQAAEKGAPDRITFAKLTRAQMVRMHGVSTTWDVLSGLLREDFRNHGHSFVLPIRQLREIPGMSPANLRKILRELERHGLITVTRKPPQPPLVTVRK
jgi:hypothetical protein